MVDYQINFTVTSSQQVTHVYHLLECEQYLKNKTFIVKLSGDDLISTLSKIKNGSILGLKYKTKQMSKPVVLYQNLSQVNGYVTLFTQFQPTFSKDQSIEYRKVKFCSGINHLKDS